MFSSPCCQKNSAILCLFISTAHTSNSLNGYGKRRVSGSSMSTTSSLLRRCCRSPLESTWGTDRRTDYVYMMQRLSERSKQSSKRHTERQTEGMAVRQWADRQRAEAVASYSEVSRQIGSEQETPKGNQTIQADTCFTLPLVCKAVQSWWNGCGGFSPSCQHENRRPRDFFAEEPCWVHPGPISTETKTIIYTLYIFTDELELSAHTHWYSNGHVNHHRSLHI